MSRLGPRPGEKLFNTQYRPNPNLTGTQISRKSPGVAPSGVGRWRVGAKAEDHKGTGVSVMPVVSADNKPGPVLANDLFELGGVFRQARHIPDQHHIRETGSDVRQHLLAPT
jgi:hypothetical protein